MEELKERYKMLPIWARLLVAAIIGLVPGGYVYFDQGDAAQAKLASAQADEEAARTAFETSRLKKANLPKLEEQKAFTEEQLVKAKKKLPDSFHIEDVLSKVATVAKLSGARLLLFSPGAELDHREPYQYKEMPITTELSGHFNEVMAFFDRVVHLEGSIFVRHIELIRVDVNSDGGGAQTGAAAGPAGDADKPSYQRQREARQAVRVHAKFDIVVFRGMTEREVAEAPADSTPVKAKGKGKGPPLPGAPPGVPAAGAPADGAAPPAAPVASRGGGPDAAATVKRL